MRPYSCIELCGVMLTPSMPGASVVIDGPSGSLCPNRRPSRSVAAAAASSTRFPAAAATRASVAATVVRPDAALARDDDEAQVDHRLQATSPSAASVGGLAAGGCARERERDEDADLAARRDGQRRVVAEERHRDAHDRDPAAADRDVQRRGRQQRRRAGGRDAAAALRRRRQIARRAPRPRRWRPTRRRPPTRRAAPSSSFTIANT